MSNLRAEAALLLIGCLMAGDKGGWHVKAVCHDSLSNEGFEAAIVTKNPKQHMLAASAQAKKAIAASGTKDAKALLNAGALAVLLLTLEKKLGSIPELVLASLSIVLDPTNGAVTQGRDTALQYFARAFAAKEALENTPDFAINCTAS